MELFIALELSAGVIFGLIVIHSHQDLLANNYGLQSSLFSLARMPIPISTRYHIGNNRLFWYVSEGDLKSLNCVYFIIVLDD
ncbi:MAG: hypothetical protein ACTIK0_07195 [Ruoffia tabacinasalis]